MSRWQPGAEDRLRRSALDLFSEHGYGAVTTTDIAEHAGLTRRSFFRHFPDKREVLFGGSERLINELEHRLQAVDPGEAEAEALQVLREAGEFLLRDIGTQRQRQQIIASSAELQERDRTKTAEIAATIARRLTQRGDDDADADLISALCAMAFRSAYDRALHDPTTGEFSTHFSKALETMKSFLTMDDRSDTPARRRPQPPSRHRQSDG